MVPDAIRIAAAFFLLAFWVIWLSNLAKIDVSRSVFVSDGEGPLLAFISRGFIALTMVWTLLSILVPSPLRLFGAGLPITARIIGIPLCFWGILGLRWTLKSLGRQFSTTLVIKDSHVLVTHGPYRWVRHPMYTAFATIFLGFFFLTDQWPVACLGLIGIGTTLWIRTPLEEQMMYRAFGSAYEDYAHRTGRFAPRLGSLISAARYGR